MNHAGEVLAGRYGQRSSLSTLTSKNNTSIEGSATNSNTSIEIPPEVDQLIDNKAYYNKFRKLLREYPREIMALVEIAHTKDQPSHWFAVATAKKNWERTLKFVNELFKVRELADRVAKKLKTAVTTFIYQQVWRGVNVERWADTAAEAGRHKAKYFTWLCKREAGASNALR
jgi:hypothetical protein